MRDRESAPTKPAIFNGEKVLCSDDLYEIVEKLSGDTAHSLQRFTRYAPTQGQFVLVLPFKHKKGIYSYLLHRSWVPGWDEHPNLAALTWPHEGDPTVGAQIFMKEVTGIDFNQQSFIPLGVCAASRWSGDSFYLFGIDLTGISELALRSTEAWVDAEGVIQSLDAQGISALARLKLVP